MCFMVAAFFGRRGIDWIPLLMPLPGECLPWKVTNHREGTSGAAVSMTGSYLAFKKLS